MPHYGFAEELAKEQLTLGFFDKVQALVKNNVKGYPPSLWDPHWRVWHQHAILEVVDDFIAGYLFEQGSKRMAYADAAARQGADIDGLMVKLFRQYLFRTLARRYPHEANLILRLGRILRELTAIDYLEQRTARGFHSYRRRGGREERTTSLDELLETVRLPAWKELINRAGAEKLSPVIGTEDLIVLVKAVFNWVDGWISVKNLRSFLFDALGLDRFRAKVRNPSVDDKENVEELVASLAIESSPQLLASLQESLATMTERQRTIVTKHFIEGHGIAELAIELGVKKSTIYAEVKTIRDLIGSNWF